MAEFDASKRLSLLDMMGLENRLADILGVPVDVAPVDDYRLKAGRILGRLKVALRLKPSEVCSG